MLRPFLIASQFLTRIPVPGELTAKEGELGSSLLFYPVVGGLIGVLLVITALLTQEINTFLSAVLVITVWVGITGGLHLDGLVDTVDAWIGGIGSKERTLEIMKDPATGPMGVLSLVLSILLKTAAVYTLINHFAIYYLLLVPVLGRNLAILLLTTTPYVRIGGLGETLAKELDREKIYIVSFVIAILLLLSINILGLYLIVCSAGLLYIARYFLLKRLGGCTGDTIGALIELTEVSALLTIVFYL